MIDAFVLAQVIAPRTIPALVGLSLLFGVVGIVVMLAAYFLFDLALQKVDVQAELNKGNVAVAIVAAAVILGAAVIAAVCVLG